MKRRELVLGTAILCAPSIARSQAPIQIKFSHVLSAATSKGKAAVKFKELAESSSGGRVRVDVYHNSTLYKDAEELEALQLGAVQMLAPSTQKFAPLGVRHFEVLDLPFLFPAQAIYDRAIGGDFGRSLLSKLEAKGVLGLAYWDGGFLTMSANRPIVWPTDMRGLRIRISGSKIDDQSLRLLGATPQVMAFSELYQALQTGVVDGAQQPASNFITQRLTEVQRYMNLLHHIHLQYAIVVNRKFWDELPPDLRSVLDRAVADATAYNNQIVAQDTVDSLAAIRASSKTEVHEPTPAEKQAFRDVLQPVYASAEGRIGKDIIGEALRAAAAPGRTG